MSDGAPPILSQLPADARGTFARLLATTVRGPEKLREQLPHYVAAIERAATTGDGPPAALGRTIAGACTALLDAWPRLDEQGQSLARAAVEYFLLCRDGDDDLATPDGLDDDAAVVAAVRDHLGV
jgi:hypothetical protein